MKPAWRSKTLIVIAAMIAGLEIMVQGDLLQSVNPRAAQIALVVLAILRAVTRQPVKMWPRQRRGLMVLPLFLLAGCAPNVTDAVADRVIARAETDEERVMRLQFGVAIISEVFRDRAESEIGKAGALLLALDRVRRVVDEIDSNDVFLETEIDRALDAVKGAIGTGIKGRLVQLVKAAAGSWGARVGLARDLVGGVGRVSAMLTDLDRALTDVANGRKTEADILVAVSERVRVNRARLRVLSY